MTPAKRKRANEALRSAAEFIDAIAKAIRERKLDSSDPELSALVDEARAHRDECFRAAQN